MNSIITNTREKEPLVHCITNYVTVNDCANILLACGGSPIMADDAAEAAQITELCAALVINIGTLNSRTVESMLRAGKRANELGHTVVLDPVGAGASELRTETAKRLIDEIRFDVIRGNMSEIKTIAGLSASSNGVDASAADAVNESGIDGAVSFIKKLSAQTGAVIAVTGAADIIADSERAYIIRNGSPKMSKVTGTGCMLSAVMAAFVAANPRDKLTAAAYAAAAMGLAGERAEVYSRGTASYRVGIIDEISNMTDEILEEGIKLEKR